jgi:hypothetical protein
VFTAASFVAHSAYGDELKLKDGTKISGTIVGFDDNSFRVKTNYGFAVVQKDQVVSIAITPAAKTEDAEKKPEQPTDRSSATAATKLSKSDAHSGSASDAAVADQPASVPASAAKKASTTAAKISAPAASSAAAANDAVPKADASHVAASAPVAPPPAAMPATTTSSVSAAPPVPAPPKPAAPEPIRESVNGNTYTNQTYGFQMYKPPDWEVIASASTLMPGAIAAMGTGDQSTYLLVGQSPAGKTLANDEDAADRRLRDIMQNFRPLEVQHLTVSGTPAIERKFRGSVDQHDWSGVVVLVPRGTQLYTIFGMTVADNDLVQIQENVIARAISSIQFTKQ